MSTDAYSELQVVVAELQDAKGSAFGILTADENSDVPVTGYPAQPSLAKRFKQAFDVVADATTRADLANSTDPAKGAELVGYSDAIADQYASDSAGGAIYRATRYMYAGVGEERALSDKVDEAGPSATDAGLLPSSEITTGLVNALGAYDRLLFPDGASYTCNQAEVADSFSLRGGSLAASIPDKGVVFAHSTAPEKITATFNGIKLNQPASSVPGGGGANNHTSLKLNGTKNSHVLGCSFETVALGLGFHYQYQGLYDDARDVFGLAAFNYLENVEKQCIEIHGAAYSRLIGNAVNSDRTNSNTIRLTGYGSDNSFLARCDGSVAAGNVIYGGSGSASGGGTPTAAGVGVQNTTRGASFAATSICSTYTGIQGVAGTTLANNPRANHFQATLLDNNRGVDNYGVENSTFDVNVDNYAEYGIIERQESRPSSGGNVYTGTVRAGAGSVNAPVRLIQPYNIVNLSIDVTAKTGIPASVIGGEGVVARVAVKCQPAEPSAVLSIPANNSVIEATAAPGSDAGVTRILVSGNNNTVTVSCPGRVIVSGSGNVIVGTAGTLRFQGNNNKGVGRFGTIQDVGTGNVVL